MQITDRRTKMDFAARMKALVDEQSPAAKLIPVVLDNLNTHTPAALYETFAPEEAGGTAGKLGFHYSAKPGCWLDMAALERAALATQCPGRCIPDAASPRRGTEAWQDDGNRTGVRIHWRLTSTDARSRLASVYPTTSTAAGY